MKIRKPKFWQKEKSFLSIIFLPISFLIIIYVFLKKKLSRPRKFKIPIICVGNIYIGGTGKTPLSILIAKELQNYNAKPVIIKKFYDNQIDERQLIENNNVPLISEKSRIKGIILAEENYDLVILDDGFQDYNIFKNLNILCFHYSQLIGNGFIFPSGPLRESFSAIKRAQIIIVNGGKNKKFEERIFRISKDVQIFYSSYSLTNSEQFKNRKILAFAGIGNPINFFDLLRSNNLNLARTLSYPDHYEFKKEELTKMIKYAKDNDYTILTTEKDYLRIEKYKLNEINFCKIHLDILEREKFLNTIKKYL
tara:strand:+ start:2868 stop:3794 length:927 start_codon:yes stop_codon:yes gene_type:complete